MNSEASQKLQKAGGAEREAQEHKELTELLTELVRVLPERNNTILGDLFLRCTNLIHAVMERADKAESALARCANEARLEALEQAAKVAEGFDGIPSMSIAAAIRALKAAPAPLDQKGGPHAT